MRINDVFVSVINRIKRYLYETHIPCNADKSNLVTNDIRTIK